MQHNNTWKSIYALQVLPELTQSVQLDGCVWLSCVWPGSGDGLAPVRSSWYKDDVMLLRAAFTAAASSSRVSCLASVPVTCAVSLSFCCCICVMLRWKKGRTYSQCPKIGDSHSSAYYWSYLRIMPWGMDINLVCENKQTMLLLMQFKVANYWQVWISLSVYVPFLSLPQL